MHGRHFNNSDDFPTICQEKTPVKSRGFSSLPIIRGCHAIYIQYASLSVESSLSTIWTKKNTRKVARLPKPRNSTGVPCDIVSFSLSGYSATNIVFHENDRVLTLWLLGHKIFVSIKTTESSFSGYKATQYFFFQNDRVHILWLLGHKYF